MKHDWQDGPYKDKYHLMMGGNKIRTCKHCGWRQERAITTSWGRITGYQWLPLAGRCKGKPAPGLSHRMQDFMNGLKGKDWTPYWSIEQTTANALVRRGLIEIRDGLHDREARRKP